MAVDVATGAVSLEVVDIGLFGNIPVQLKRRYSTANLGRRGVFGPGWRWDFGYSARQTLEGYTCTLPSGAVVQFHRPPGDTSQRLFSPSARLELRIERDDQVVLIEYGNDRNPNELVFTSIGARNFRLTSVRNRSNVRVELAYDEIDRLRVVRQIREHREIRLSYERRGLLEAATVTRGPEQLGVQVRYDYDVAGRLVTVSDQDGVKEQYAYDQADKLTSDARRTGVVYLYAYDASDRCVQARGADGLNERQFSYQPEERTSQVRDSHGELWSYEYNDAGQITKATSPTGVSSTTVYTDDGQVAREVQSNGIALVYEYDALGRLVKTTYPRDLTEKIEYDAEHYPIGFEDFRGHRLAFERDQRGLMTALALQDGRRIEYAYNDTGDLVLMRDPVGEEVHFDYNAYGKIIARSSASGGTWRYDYNELSLMVRKQNPVGGVTEYSYDSQQRIAWRREPDGLVTQFRYLPNEQVQQRSDGTYNYRRFAGCGHTLETRDFSGSVSRFEWDTEQARMLAYHDARGGVHRFEYNGDGDLVSHTYPGGRSAHFEWKLRQLAAIVDRAGRRIEYEYDDLGYLIKAKSADGEIEYKIDPKHFELLKLTAGESVMECERDEFGKLCELRSEGVTIRQRYEARDRLAEFETSLGDHVRFDYNANGQLQSADFGFCKQEFKYDTMGREVARELVGAGRLAMQRDIQGRLVELVFQSAKPALAMAAGAEALSTVTGFNRSYDWAPADRLTRQVDSLRGWRRFVHGPSLELMAVDESSGNTHFYGYDAGGNRHFAATVADNHALIQQAVDPSQPVPWPTLPSQALLRGGSDEHYQYDADGQLLEVRSPQRTLRYEYDQAGYVTAKHVLTSFGQATWRYGWNAFGWLVDVETPKGEHWKYRYDGAGRRVARISPEGESTRYVWYEDAIIYELKGDQAIFYGNHPEAHELLAVRGKEPLHVVSDHIGAPSELISTDGQIKGLLSRDSWGRRLDSETLPHIFPGQFRDEETGLSYNCLRYYDPDVGRYLSPDPFDLLASTNLYAYQSPELSFDPEGAMRRGPTIVPAQDATVNDQGTMINSQGTPTQRGSITIPTEEGPKTIPMSQATVTTVSDGNTPVAHTLNGVPNDTTTKKAGDLAKGSGAGSTTWWHSEQNAMTGVIRGDIPVAQGGSDPLRFDISRPPCERGCMHHIGGLAQEVANAKQRTVVVTWPEVEIGEDGKKTVTTKKLEVKPSTC